MKTLIYTFRTCPFKEKIPKAFIFGKLKQDFLLFSKKILINKPKIIIGVAKSRDSSHFEKLIINQFNKTKKINLNGKDSFNLYTPKNPPFSISDKPTNSFCNWTSYKIKELIEEKNLDAKLIFIHLNEKDINKFYLFLETQGPIV